MPRLYRPIVKVDIFRRKRGADAAQFVGTTNATFLRALENGGALLLDEDSGEEFYAERTGKGYLRLLPVR